MKFDKSKKKIIIVICGFSILIILSIILIPSKTIQIKADNPVIRNYQTTEIVPEANFEPKTAFLEISHYSEQDSCHYPTKGGCLTASGKIAKVGMVATNLYPFGTRLEIDGQIYTVEDRISKRYNNRIDIFTGYGEEAHRIAIQNGIQKKNVKIIN